MIFRTPNDEEGVAMRPNEMVGIPRVVFFKEFQDRVEGKPPIGTNLSCHQLHSEDNPLPNDELSLIKDVQ